MTGTYEHPAAAHKRAAATMLITDPAGLVLVVKPTYKPLWELPGGLLEEGESPGAAAVREVAEELGLARCPGRLLAVDHVPATERRGDALIVVFDGGIVEQTVPLRLPADELSAHAFVEPDLLGDYLTPLVTRRARAALAARASGVAVYLEDGHPDDHAYDPAPGTDDEQRAPGGRRRT